MEKATFIKVRDAETKFITAIMRNRVTLEAAINLLHEHRNHSHLAKEIDGCMSFLSDEASLIVAKTLFLKSL